ncbi:hypothetical protein F2Q70_00002410 [Brassica cretica]|uniref:Uncharacterized protein n=1 Tax=Brassica cretica TaxID=69181 RepID=A0A8S9IYV6_BRACR|nr:hypothetical protein F2Q70_00002410 [Brassica cretica]
MRKRPRNLSQATCVLGKINGSRTKIFRTGNTTTPKTTSSSSSLDQEDQKIAMANEKIVRLENDKNDQGKVMKYLQNLAHKIVSKFPEFLDEDEDEDEDATQE